jgi:hypothetical protein
VNGWDGHYWYACTNIIEHAADERIYSLAPLIDSLVTFGVTSKMIPAGLFPELAPVLARLKYKDYPQQQQQKYLHFMDSCIMYLENHPELNKWDVFQTTRDIAKCYRNISYYIGGTDIYYRMAPLLLITNIMNNFGDIRYSDYDTSVGVYFLYKYFMRDITNIPIPDGIMIWDWDKNNIPVKMYQWMMKNKNKYKLRKGLWDDD